MVTLILSNSFQKLWCGSTDFTNVTNRDFVPFPEAKMSVSCCQNLFKINFLDEKWVYNPLETQKLISHKSLHWLTFLLLLKLKNAKDHWFRTPKFYICIILLVACWKFQKICRQKDLWGAYYMGVRFFWPTLYFDIQCIIILTT